MPEWLYEAGIGEARAALVADNRILKVRIEPDDGAVRVGTVTPARLIEITRPGREGRITLDDGGEATFSPLPPGITQGSRLTVRIVRAAIPEAGRPKRPRAAPTDEAPGPGPDLLARITATGHPVRTLRAHEPDALEQSGWSEVLEEALTGEIAFAGGALRMTPTPAMTLFDVDGTGDLDSLALAAATAVAEAIVRHDIGGSIGIDFPTITGKAPRLAVAGAIDDALPGPFERTAVNGFGFLQIVRPRIHASLPERLRADPSAAKARALLRQIERTPPPVPRRHRVSARLLATLAAHPTWVEDLARRTGVVPTFELE
ncbi:ribonuclease [Sphingomonas sp. Leaf357]|uniref:ribonuclease n=1 Tax=Sphingomonas sp. Leaf357 TaxID=1736350 RepID=UPI0006F2228A|nr:ribonuclease [Sphingomonas sp. Leaf357]KQS02297.1 ribonuclease [Sphingomonas sp. Leaf357]